MEEKSKKICSVDGCDKDSKLAGLCRHHYYILKVKPKEEHPMEESLKCSLVDCQGIHYGKGFCKHHYGKWKRHGDPMWVPPIFVYNKCSIANCGNDALALGVCNKHYKRFSKYKDHLVCKTDFHGMTNTSEYISWKCMKDRCNVSATNGYKYYGGKGVKVCDRWENSFSNFIKDMGNKPTLKHQIDRLDSSKDYTPDNCRWATPTENIRDRDYTKLTTKKASEIRDLYNNSNMSQSELAEEYGVSTSNIWHIINDRRWTNA